MGNTYRAFISYSHSDAAVARWLHARLETYRLPGEIAQLMPAGERKGRLGPIFRDREELPASQDLSASVRAALAASDVLVVLCSPEARASLWVKREIELFRELHPDRPILAAIVRGEPGEAIPAPLLLDGEPLAADLRKEGDGRRLGFLKVVAGIAGVPLDALVQRDVQRKMRRVMAVTLVTAAGALAMAIMTIVAIQSRNEAERQRTEAEGLVEFMLTDLRGELRGVGRLDVMRGVNERAMAYYEAQGDLSGWSAPSLERRARILQAMGEDETNREGGDLAEALAMFREAERTTAELRRQDPDNADRIFGHSQSQYWVGRVAELRKDYDGAAGWYGAYRQSTLALAELEPASIRTLEELGHAETNSGIIALERPDPSLVEAQAHFEIAVGWFSKALETGGEGGERRYNLANAWSWLANTHFDAGRFTEAMPAWEESAALKRQIAEADPADLGARYDLLIAERALAMNNAKLGNIAMARESLHRLVTDTSRLSARDPKNAGWRELAMKVHAEFKALN